MSKVELTWYKTSTFFKVIAYGLASLYPLYWAKVLHFDEVAIGHFTTISLALSVVAPVVFGIVAARHTPHKVVLTSCVACAVAVYFSLHLKGGIAQAICFGAYQFFRWGFFTIVPVGVLGCLTENIGQEYASYQRVSTCGFLLGLLVPATVADSFGLGATLHLAAFTALAAAWPFCRKLTIPKPVIRKETSYLELLKAPLITPLFFSMLFLSTLGAFIFTFLPLRMMETGASTGQISIVLALTGGFSVLGLPWIGRIVDRVPATSLLPFLPIAGAVRIALLGLPSDGWYWFAAQQVLHIPTWVLQDVLFMRILRTHAEPAHLTRLQGLLHSAATLGTGLGTLSCTLTLMVPGITLQQVFFYLTAAPLLAYPFIAKLRVELGAGSDKVKEQLEVLQEHALAT